MNSAYSAFVTGNCPISKGASSTVWAGPSSSYRPSSRPIGYVPPVDVDHRRQQVGAVRPGAALEARVAQLAQRQSRRDAGAQVGASCPACGRSAPAACRASGPGRASTSGRCGTACRQRQVVRHQVPDEGVRIAAPSARPSSVVSSQPVCGSSGSGSPSGQAASVSSSVGVTALHRPLDVHERRVRRLGQLPRREILLQQLVEEDDLLRGPHLHRARPARCPALEDVLAPVVDEQVTGVVVVDTHLRAVGLHARAPAWRRPGGSGTAPARRAPAARTAMLQRSCVSSGMVPARSAAHPGTSRRLPPSFSRMSVWRTKLGEQLGLALRHALAGVPPGRSSSFR